MLRLSLAMFGTRSPCSNCISNAVIFPSKLKPEPHEQVLYGPATESYRLADPALVRQIGTFTQGCAGMRATPAMHIDMLKLLVNGSMELKAVRELIEKRLSQVDNAQADLRAMEKRWKEEDDAVAKALKEKEEARLAQIATSADVGPAEESLLNEKWMKEKAKDEEDAIWRSQQREKVPGPDLASAPQQ